MCDTCMISRVLILISWHVSSLSFDLLITHTRILTLCLFLPLLFIHCIAWLVCSFLWLLPCILILCFVMSSSSLTHLLLCGCSWLEFHWYLLIFRAQSEVLHMAASRATLSGLRLISKYRSFALLDSSQLSTSTHYTLSRVLLVQIDLKLSNLLRLCLDIQLHLADSLFEFLHLIILSWCRGAIN